MEKQIREGSVWAGGDRRSAPRIMPLPSGIYSSTGSKERDRTLLELKELPKVAGVASFFYFDSHFQFNAVKVLPGELFVANESLVIMTVLGSCISACLWDSRANLGGMNHFMLPDGDSIDASGRYGSYAMELLINEMLKRGARRETMQAKIFGGAQVMQGFTTLNIGERNTSFVIEYLKAEKIPVVSEDVMDIYPRKVCFFPVTGKAMVKRLIPTDPNALAAREKSGDAQSIARAAAGGSVVLF